MDMPPPEMFGSTQGLSAVDRDDEEEDIRVISQQIIDKKAFIWSFGKNKDGELGIGSQKDAFLPRPIAGELKDG